MAKPSVPSNPKSAGAGPGVLPRPGTAAAAGKRAPHVAVAEAPGHVGTGHAMPVSELVRSIEAGLPVRELDALRADLDLPMDRLATMLGISKATLHRRKAAGRLAVAESDRVVRFARLLGRAAEVMESAAAGRRWLTSAQVGLGGAVPLEYAQTEVGAREVENLLGRIEYGVYS